MAKPPPATRLSDVLAGSLPGRIAGKLPEPALLAAWRRAAGELIAARARPVCLEPGGVLVVAAPGGPWRQELALAGPGLCEALCRDGFAVVELKLVNARTPPPPPPPEPPPRDLSPQEEQALARTLAPVRDQKLRQALERAMRAQLSAGPAPDK